MAASQTVDVRIRIVFDIDEKTGAALRALGWTPPESWNALNEAGEKFASEAEGK